MKSQGRNNLLSAQNESDKHEGPIPLPSDQIALVRSGDMRQLRNRTTWSAQEAMEVKLAEAFREFGYSLKEMVRFDPALGHRFIHNQRMGIDIFREIDPDTRLVVAISAWQYSHHILAGLRDHRGPILTIANWSGRWPGLVGLLNLNACLVKISKPFSTIWSEDFKDPFFLNGLKEWLDTGFISHNINHLRKMEPDEISSFDMELGRSLAEQLLKKKAIIGVFDEGCMGMYNAIIDDEYLNQIGIYKERLSQSALLAEMSRVSDGEALSVRAWLENQGMKFITGSAHEKDL
ncbi:MAG: fucose isomerase, partial [Chloroflexota bacterium]|nr:fucose isomerase [Chloroflexota bacterium]